MNGWDGPADSGRGRADERLMIFRTHKMEYGLGDAGRGRVFRTEVPFMADSLLLPRQLLGTNGCSQSMKSPFNLLEISLIYIVILRCKFILIL